MQFSHQHFPKEEGLANITFNPIPNLTLQFFGKIHTGKCLQYNLTLPILGKLIREKLIAHPMGSLFKFILDAELRLP